MTTHIALLRGINVGRAKRIAMADLRAAVESIGATNVRTLLNSGNVIFELAKAGKTLDARIHDAVVAKTGVSASVITMTARELAVALDGNPIADLATDPSRFLVAVLHRDVDRARLGELLDTDWSPDVLRSLVSSVPKVLYLWCPAGILESRLVSEMSRLLKDSVTTRNLTTMTKLRGLAGEL